MCSIKNNFYSSAKYVIPI